MTADITARVIAILNNHGIISRGGAEITEATYLASLNMVGLDAVEFAMAMEETFGIDLPYGWEAELLVLRCVRWDMAQIADLAAYIEALLGAPE